MGEEMNEPELCICNACGLMATGIVRHECGARGLVSPPITNDELVTVYRWLLSLPLPSLTGPYHWQIEADRERLIQRTED